MTNEIMRDGRDVPSKTDPATASTVREDAQHTPGPWEAHFDEMAGYDCMFGAWGITQRNRSIPNSIAVVDQGSYGQVACDTSFRSAEAEANARLIAAAPEMLTACKLVLDCETRHDDKGHAYLHVPARSLTDVSMAVFNAVRKAEGR